MATWIRRIVSGQKKRFQDDGFDLDLAYISPRIIAMGLPATSQGEQLYRNPMPEIARFMHTYHPGRAKVYNLCSEHKYSRDRLLTALQHYPFDDHQTPALLVVQQFCRDAAAWLAADPHNVVVVHCKAGKGRTGIMICCLLLYLHLNSPDLANLDLPGEPGASEDGDAADADRCSVSSVSSGGSGSSKGWHPWQSVPAVQLRQLAHPLQDVLQLYAERRTHDGNGVTIASQRRYVAYFWRVLSNGPRPCGTLPSPRTVQLRQLVISGLPVGSADSCLVVVEARPSGSTAASGSRVLVCPGPRAISSGLPGLCLGPCTEPLVREDGCRVAIRSSATAGDTLTVSMPAASMGLSLLSHKQQQQQQALALAGSPLATSQPGCCSVCRVIGGCACLGGSRLSPAVLPFTADAPAAVDAAAAYGLAGGECPPCLAAAGAATAHPMAVAAAPPASELELSESGDQQGCCVVEGDVRILIMRGGARWVYTWFNTAFLPAGGCYTLKRSQLDKPSKALSDELHLTVRYVDMQPQAKDEEEDAGLQAAPEQLPQKQQQHQQQQMEEDGFEGVGAGRQPTGQGSWTGLGKRVLTSSSHKRQDGGNTAKRSCSHQQQARTGLTAAAAAAAGVTAGAAGGSGTSISGREQHAAAPPGAAAAGAEPMAAGNSVGKRARQPAPHILVGSSSISALAGMGHERHERQQRQQRQHATSVSAPASPQGDGKGKLSRSSSWKWQHLPAISSLSSSLWEWASAAGAVQEADVPAAGAAGGSSAGPRRDVAAGRALSSRLSWDWDWPSLSAVAVSEPVFGGDGAAGAGAAAAAANGPAALDSATSEPAGMVVFGAPLAGAAAVPADKAHSMPLKAQQQSYKSKKVGNGSGSSSRYRPIMQDLHTGGLSRSPAAIELPLLKRPSGASSIVDALLDPAVSVGGTSSSQLCAQLPHQQPPQQPAGKVAAAPNRGGSSSSREETAAASGRKSVLSLWQMFLQQQQRQHGTGLVHPQPAAGTAAGTVHSSEGWPAANGSVWPGRDVAGTGNSKGRSGHTPHGRNSEAAAAPPPMGAAAAAAAGAGGNEDAEYDDGGDTYPTSDVLTCSESLSQLFCAEPLASANFAGSSDPLQGLLEALNWSTDSWRHTGPGSSSSSTGSSSWQQGRRRHTYSGPKASDGGSGGGGSSSGASSPLVKQSLGKLKKVHSAPNTPPGLMGQQGSEQDQQQQQRGSKTSADAHAHQLICRLLDLEVDTEPTNPVAASGSSCQLQHMGPAASPGAAGGASKTCSAAAAAAAGGGGGGAGAGAGQPSCCLDCVFDLHVGPCPLATSTAALMMGVDAADGPSQPLQSARSCPVPSAQGSSARLCDADVRIIAAACPLAADSKCSMVRKGGAGHSKAAAATAAGSPWRAHGSDGHLLSRAGVAASASASSSSCREKAEQLQGLLAAAAADVEDNDTDFAASSQGGMLSSSGSATSPSLTQQWKQLEKAWQRSWWV